MSAHTLNRPPRGEEGVRLLLEEMNAAGEFPALPAIRRFEVWAGHDSTGDPSYLIWVLVDEGTADEDLTLAKVRPLERLIFDAVFEGPDGRWPYIRTMTESEFSGDTPG